MVVKCILAEDTIRGLVMGYVCVARDDGLKLNGTHQLLAYADDINILGGSINTVKENAEALIAASREIGLEVSADKTKYMVMSRDQNAGRIVLLTQYCAGDKIEKNEMGWACGAYG